MEGWLHPVGARLGRTLVAVAVAAAALLLVASLGPPDASAKGKKVRACVVKKGPDKGVMRFSPKGKCHKGEKKLSWGKKGKKGKRGAAGPAGPAGPQGSPANIDELLATIAVQQAAIDALTTQLDGVTSQLNTLAGQINGILPDVAALCSSMPAVVTQANAMRTVLNGIVLAGLIPAGLVLTVPATPPALSSFGCP